MPVILVTGATGKIGQHLVHELVARGATPRVYARNEEKARAAFASLSGGGSIEYAVGTNEDLGALAQAARGAERLFLVSNDPHGEPAMVRAALDAGVRHVVKISAVMAGSSHESGTFVWAHGIAERAIQDMKAPVTVLRPHDFMENFLGSAGTIKAQGAFYGNQGDSCIASIAAKDIAAAAAGVLTAPIEEYAGLTFTLTVSAVRKERFAVPLAAPQFRNQSSPTFNPSKKGPRRPQPQRAGRAHIASDR
ncbi:hypothetical protein DFJ73DRAFT_127411 [Zopfochytrium polystomum]|nr:hypothetical protein DFJ73DRAFT_127411 [Zopfochytrium polystomum]